MKTHELIHLLAREIEPLPRRSRWQWLARPLLATTVAAAVIVLGLYGLNPDIAQALGSPVGWLKILLPGALAAAAFVAVQRLARPGMTVGRTLPLMTAGLAGWWLHAGLTWLQAPAEARIDLVLGSRADSCSLSIALIALPMLAGVLLALRDQAPTRPALAGAFAGVLAGTVGALLYALHCPELDAPFVALWYSLGVALVSATGALAGYLLLRW